MLVQRLPPPPGGLAEGFGGAPLGPDAPFLSLEWPWKVRVGANPPSLCPTMFSVTNTVTILCPLWTANDRPTNSGVTVERRDQVWISVRSLVVIAVVTFF